MLLDIQSYAIQTLYGFRIAVSGKPTDTEYISDLSVDGVNTETDMQRIHKYSVEDYITNISHHQAQLLVNIDDNFIIKYGSGDQDMIEYMDLAEIPLDVLNPSAVIIREPWENLDNWTRQHIHHMDTSADTQPRK
jgi:hypothetical protein